MQRLWQESAYFWDKHRATIAEMFAPLTDALIESAHIAADGPGRARRLSLC